MRNVKNASIIITTPEKWDSITRKWKDHAKLMQLIKLFLIDEVHVLKEERGATLEAVVSRMKSVGSDVRFLALSATVPNSEDVAEWLGKDSINQHLPAPRERFGEEFRPVLLQKHVCGYPSNGNDWALNKMLDNKLPDVIAKYSQKKPIMAFCCTRRDTVSTARTLANWWSTKTPRERFWEAPLRQTQVADSDLKFCVSAGVAFHHAGMPPSDREAVENGFLTGNINVICCTSTLAVGVNLPCHFVIIKNTATYTDKGLKEYSDLEIMQMLGRAGRPQFDKSAVGVIMTRQEKVKRYELMVSGQEVLESRLHQNLIDHLNAEIGLGTIRDLATAKKWLSGTFLSVRMKNNPEHYRLEGDSGGRDMDQRLEHICNRDITLLRELNLIEGERLLKSTEYGDAMARYCVQFETAKNFLSLPPKAKLSEILSTVAQAAEFKEVRFRSGEKQAYKDLNKSPMIKFPIHVNLDLPAHKVSLIIQSQLGSVDLPTDEKNKRNKIQYSVDANIIFHNVHRLIRCIIDFLLCTDDSVALRNALMLCRSVGAKCWDDSSLTLKQVEGIGPAAIRKLVNANVRSPEEMASSEAHTIEMALGRHPPFGMQMVQKLKNFPVLRVDVAIVGKMTVRAGEGATLHIRSDIGFMNERPPETYRQKPIYLIFLAEISNGRKVHFARISARKVGSGQDIKFAATVTDPAQSVICHIMCEDLAGTLRSASIQPSNIPSIAWPTSTNSAAGQVQTDRPERVDAAIRASTGKRSEGKQREASEDFGANCLKDEDFLQAAEAAGDLEFQHIDTLLGEESSARMNTAANSGKKRQQRTGDIRTQEDWQPTRLVNGKWACNHKCKDKTNCKHLCCREGADKPPKPPKKGQKANEENEIREAQKQWKNRINPLPNGQTQLNLPAATTDKPSALQSSDSLQEIDLTQLQRPKSSVNKMHTSRPKELKSLERLHSMVQRAPTPPKINLPKYGTQARFITAGMIAVETHSHHATSANDFSTDYGDSWPEGFSIAGSDRDEAGRNIPKALVGCNEEFEDYDSLLDDAMTALAESQDLRASRIDVDGKAEWPKLEYENRRNDATDDDVAELYEPPSPPTRRQAPSIREAKTKDVSESSEPLPTVMEVMNKQKEELPFTESSPLFTTSTTPQKRKAETQDHPRTPVNESKRSKFLADSRKENDALRIVLVDSQKDKREEIAHEESRDTMEELDPWLQEFGKYVDFV